MRRLRSVVFAAAAFFVSGSLCGAANARSAGLAALGCEGCHGGGKPATVTLSASNMNPGVGEPVTLTISVSQTNGTTAGFYLTTAFENFGTFQTVESGTVADSSGVQHTTPRAGSGGATTFKAQWTAKRATGVSFDVYALSANADRTNRGDGAGVASLTLAAGCVGERYYIDQDGDGFGSDDPAYRTREDCAAPLGYAAKPGDCNDFRAEVHPGAPELCDLVDNDCNGAVDDAVVSQAFCEDRDGDGHGVKGRETKMDCKPTAGFGACDGDCDDGDPKFFPGAEEICDLRDNDCDGEVDEGVLPVCGVGLCSRRAVGCNEADCTPGEPLPEVCNGYDDDCDGVIDNADSGSLCGQEGVACVAGHCGGTSGGPGAPTAGTGGGSSAAAGSSGGGSDAVQGGGPSAPPAASSGCAMSAPGAAGHGSVQGWTLAILFWASRRRGVRAQLAK